MKIYLFIFFMIMLSSFCDNMIYIELNNKVKIPILGLGTYQINNEEDIINALNVGYRLIDTATMYGNEKIIGNAIKKSKINRKEIFIITKLLYSGYQNTLNEFNKSLKNLQVDYIDLYLIHEPYGNFIESWKAIEELYKQGKIRAIGVSNFYTNNINILLNNSTISPMVNQIEINPFNQEIELKKYMEKNNIQLIAWSPFAEGKNEIFNNKILLEMSKKYNKTSAQIILRWLIQRNIIVIPKSSNIKRLKENFNVFDFELKQEDMKKIEKIDLKKSSFFYTNGYKD